MKQASKLLVSLGVFAALIIISGCKKDKKDINKDPKGAYSFSNTEYTGLAKVGNHYYSRPLSLRFGAGDDVTAWSYLTLSVAPRRCPRKDNERRRGSSGADQGHHPF